MTLPGRVQLLKNTLNTIIGGLSQQVFATCGVYFFDVFNYKMLRYVLVFLSA